MEDAKLLLVDDDPGIIQVLSRMLSGWPNLRFATCGADALRLAREVAPDLILLDAEMPGMSGFEVYQSLKADPLLAAIPVIFATSNLQAAMEAAALEAGAVDFVPKPLVAAQVLARVRAQLAGRPHAAVAGGDGNSAPARLLIVDADAATAQAARQALAGTGDCLVAAGAEEALRLADSGRPDVIVVDAGAHGTEGLALCKRLKADAALSQVPLIVVARQPDARLEVQAFDLGAADVMVRPVVPAVLRARVSRLLRAGRRAEAHPPPGDSVRPDRAWLLSRLAHEIVGPVGGLLDLAHLMAGDAAQQLPPRQAGRLEQIEASGRRLQALTHDLLELGRFEAGHCEIGRLPVDAVTCAEGALAAAAVAADQAQVALKLTRPAAGCIAGDAEQLQRCLLERLLDAIERAGPGDQVDVAVRTEDGEVSVEVNCDGSDHCQARSAADLLSTDRAETSKRRETPPFAPAEDSIGLLLTRQRVGAMGGRLSIGGNTGRGSSARLSFASV